MPVTRDDVRKIAKLAKLSFSEEETARLTGQLGSILEYVRVLEGAPLDSVEPMAHAMDVACPARDDVAKESLPRDAALQNAPDKADGTFKVPEVIENV